MRFHDENDLLPFGPPTRRSRASASLRKTGLRSTMHELPRSILVCGAARNCGRRLGRDLIRLRRATSWIPRVRFLVVESDSTDGTVAALESLAADHADFRVVSLGHTRDRLPERTDRIALARNTCLEAFTSDPDYADADHFLMADLDGMCRDLSPQALRSCWRLDVPWDACTANQGDFYYDIWTLRHRCWCPGDAWEEYRQLVPLLGETEATNVAVFSRMVHIPATAPPIEVDSAFGGLGIYKRAAVTGLRYAGRDAGGRPASDHVALNLAMRSRGGQIIINPALINARRTSHAGRKRFWRTLRRRLWKGVTGRGWN
jgi:glycosyltransferase involved in cell wall biosynthesis